MLSRVPRTGGPVTQTLSLDANLGAGYDDNVAGDTTSGNADPTSMRSGTAATLDGGLQYVRGNARHSLRLDSRGMAYHYPDYLSDPVAGVSVVAGLRTTVGRSTALDGSQTFGSEPFFSAFAPAANVSTPTLATQQAIPITGLFERRSRHARTSVSVAQPLGARHSLSAGYTYGTRQFSDDQVGDNSSHATNTGYAVAVSDALRLRGDYQYTTFDLRAEDSLAAPQTDRTHRVEGGLDLQLASRGDRPLTLMAVAGAARLESTGATDAAVPGATAWVPVATAGLGVPLGATWSIEASYRREFSLLQGISTQLFSNDASSLSLRGALTRRTAVLVGATLGDWRVPNQSGRPERFRVYGVNLQVRQMLNNVLGLTAGYTYYQHRLADLETLPLGFPSEYGRRAVRIGLSLRLPLIGPRPAQASVTR